MEDMDKKLVEKLDVDFHKWASKEGWDPCDITLMKDLQKLMYYIEVRDAMKNGTKQYPGSEYMEDERSYRRGRNAMGQFTSGHQDYGYDNYDGRSMHNMPMNDAPWDYDGRYYEQGSGRRYYDDMRASGRRYYDSEKDNTVNYLRRMMDSETRPDMKTAMQNVLRELESK